MVRKSLIVVALLAVSTPLAAQQDEESYVWSSNRPDAQAPLGVMGERVLEQGHFELTYKFTQMNSRGVWYVSDSLPIATTLKLYSVAPATLSKQTHTVMAAFGLAPDLTILGTAEFSVYDREQYTATSYFVTTAQALGDITATAIYQVYASGPFRMTVSGGVVLPVGEARTWACTPFATGCVEDDSTTPHSALPYDMRPGGGTFAVMPGISGEVQNEHGSLGAQFKGRINIGSKSVDPFGAVAADSSFTYGDVYEANGWAAYRFNDVISISAGIRWQTWGKIEGGDPLLSAGQDPGNDAVSLSGQRVDMPLGINFVVPGNSFFAGHRLFLESVYAMHHDYEGPQLGLDWGINLGWRVDF